MRFLLVSLVASVVLTVVLNAAMRAPSARRRLTEGIDRMVQPPDLGTRSVQRRTRVVFPWKLMLIGSIVLTVLVNLMAAMR